MKEKKFIATAKLYLILNCITALQQFTNYPSSNSFLPALVTFLFHLLMNPANNLQEPALILLVGKLECFFDLRLLLDWMASIQKLDVLRHYSLFDNVWAAQWRSDSFPLFVIWKPLTMGAGVHFSIPEIDAFPDDSFIRWKLFDFRTSAGTCGRCFLAIIILESLRCLNGFGNGLFGNGWLCGFHFHFSPNCIYWRFIFRFAIAATALITKVRCSLSIWISLAKIYVYCTNPSAVNVQKLWLINRIMDILST